MFAFAACSPAVPPSQTAPQPRPPSGLAEVEETPWLTASREPFGALPSCNAPEPEASASYLLERSAQGASAPVVDELWVDLDGDGRPDWVRVRFAEERSDVLVTIGDGTSAPTRWLYSGRYEPIRAVDIDPDDGRTELLFGSEGIASFDGTRIDTLRGQAHSLTQSPPSTSARRVSHLVRDDEIVVRFDWDGHSLHTRFPTHGCRPSVSAAQRDIDPRDERTEWLLSIGDPHGPQTFVLASVGSDGIRGYGPWVAANSVDVLGPSRFEVTHWDCGVRAVHRYASRDGAWHEETRDVSGERDVELCGRVQLLSADLDGDGSDEDIVARPDLVVVDGVKLRRSGIECAPELWRRRAASPSTRPVSDYENFNVSVVDIDGTDSRRELLVGYWGDYDDHTSYVYSFDGQHILSSEVIQSQSALEFPGSGDLAVTRYQCGVERHEQWTLRDHVLVRSRVRNVGRFRLNQCAD